MVSYSPAVSIMMNTNIASRDTTKIERSKLMVVDDEEMEVESQAPLNLHEVMNLPINFENLQLILSKAHSAFVKNAEGQDLVLCCGSQGSGKSTLLSSLFYGPR